MVGNSLIRQSLGDVGNWHYDVTCEVDAHINGGWTELQVFFLADLHSIHMYLMCFLAGGSGGYDISSLLSALSSGINTKVQGWVVWYLRLCSTNPIISLQRHVLFSFFNPPSAEIDTPCLEMLLTSSLGMFLI